MKKNYFICVLFVNQDLPALKTHSKIHQNVLPIVLYVTCQESFEGGYNKKKRPCAPKTDDLETVLLPKRHAHMLPTNKQ